MAFFQFPLLLSENSEIAFFLFVLLSYFLRNLLVLTTGQKPANLSVCVYPHLLCPQIFSSTVASELFNRDAPMFISDYSQAALPEAVGCHFLG